jgi:predicted nucleic-acid-binding protein
LIGLDANVLVRYVVQDDAAQAAAAVTLIESLSIEKPGYVTLVALAELCWVLNRSYRLRRNEFAAVVNSLLVSTEIRFENEKIVQEALELFLATNADFDDCLIERCSHAAGCDFAFTFDRKAAKAIGMQLLDS